VENIASIEQLKYFRVVCQHETLTLAAEELHISQPALTKAIQRLETKFGFLLFSRHHNRLTLTAEGGELLVLCDSLFDSLDQFMVAAQAIGDHHTHHIRLCVPPLIGTIIVSQIYSIIVQASLNIRLEVIEYTLRDALHKLKNGDLDLAILTNHDVAPELDSRLLFQTEIVFCVHKNHPLASKASICPSDLEGFPLSVLNSGSFHHTKIMELFQESCVKPNIVLQSVELDTITQMIINHGSGIFTYKDIFKAHESIVSIPVDIPPVKISIAWKRSKYISVPQKRLVEKICGGLRRD
jgi:DNA-binding transcriptional LysR family regulator